MPVWHERTRAHRESGRLRMVGIVQDQHADRASLFMQWKRMDWPVLVDSLNVTAARVVPLVWALDEQGMVRSVRPRPDFIDAFVNTTYPAVKSPPVTIPPSLDDLEQHARTAAGARAFGDALLMRKGDLDGAVAAYRRAVELEPSDGRNHFRLGVAFRRRCESAHRQPGDFQAAVRCWSRALTRDPGQYIWRRRIQQYGPRLDKPYNFFAWVDRARSEIRQRGETPVALRVEPRGTEIQGKIRTLQSRATSPHPDPEGKIPRDGRGAIEVEVVAAPTIVPAGRPVKIHVIFRPTDAADWNNETEPLRVWMKVPDGWPMDSGMREVAGTGATSREARVVEFEIRVPKGTAPGKTAIRLAAFYNVCRKPEGTCMLLRRDLKAEIEVIERRPSKRRG